MKKIWNIVLILSILFTFILLFNPNPVQAAALDDIEIATNKNIVNPGDTVILTITFGKPLGAYTFDIAYDNNLLEYVETNGGTANDNGTRVRVVYYDTTGGTNPKESMNITFKAKEGIITSNPTDLAVTAEGLSNPDASESYDDITTPLEKNIVVEPKYEDYTFDLSYTGGPIVNEEKEMILSLTSSMGRSYAHARIIAEATTPDGGNVQLKGTDETQTEYDIIDSGWGDPSGYPIGGQNVNKVLNLRGMFDKAGEYTLTFKLIDRDSSDTVITEKTFTVTVTDKETTPPEETPENGVGGIIQEENTTEENLPTQLPKTGMNIYVPIVVVFIAIISTFSYIFMKKKKQ